MNQDPNREAKLRAAREAVDLVKSGMVLGLGTGSTAALVVEELGRRLAEGKLDHIVGIPTSRATHQQALLVGVPVGTLEEHPRIDLTVDGADEVDPTGNLIKGLGGALLREKVVATASRRLIIVVDESKQVNRLGTRAPLPVEVVQFGYRSHDELIGDLGGVPTLRLDTDGQRVVTDEGHWIIDVLFEGGIPSPAHVERLLKGHPGVVETGLFLDLHPKVIVGRAG